MWLFCSLNSLFLTRIIPGAWYSLYMSMGNSFISSYKSMWKQSMYSRILLRRRKLKINISVKNFVIPQGSLCPVRDYHDIKTPLKGAFPQLWQNARFLFTIPFWQCTYAHVSSRLRNTFESRFSVWCVARSFILTSAHQAARHPSFLFTYLFCFGSTKKVVESHI